MNLSMDRQALLNSAHTDEEAELWAGILDKLGYVEKKEVVPRKPAQHSTAPPEYCAIYIFNCATCGGSYKQYILMKKTESGGDLSGIPVDTVPDNIKSLTFNKRVRYCRECRGFLSKQSVDYLVNKIMEEIHR